MAPSPVCRCHAAEAAGQAQKTTGITGIPAYLGDVAMLSVALSLVLAAAAIPPNGETEQDRAALLTGDWKLVGLTIAGQDIPLDDTNECIMHFEQSRPGKVVSGSKAAPRKLTLVPRGPFFLAHDVGQDPRMLISIRDDTLLMCCTNGGASIEEYDMRSTPQNGYLLYAYRRVGK
jgi:hypothetical protein